MDSIASAVARHALADLCRVGSTTWDTRELAIVLLCHQEQQTVRGLSATLKLNKVYVSRTVSTLVASGCLVKRDDPDDGRNVFITLGDRGHAIVSSVSSIVANAIRTATGGQ